MKNLHKLLLGALCMGVAVSATGAERTLKVTDRYMVVPVSHKFDRVRLKVAIPGLEDMPVVVRIPQDGKAEYYTFRDMSAHKGKKITITYPDGLKGIDLITFKPEIPDEASIYHEPNRPQMHFTTRRGWINDPNGLVYYDGEYHLFYQHNPYERDWENMTWGHAVSNDLVHWQELPTAIHPDSLGTIFSGSAVIDYRNTSSFGKKDKPAMVAFYTIETGGKGQKQGMAYSLDNGRTFTKYAHNPIIDSTDKWQTNDTRDPRVFPYGDHWVMVLNERDGHSIYRSDNLRDWTFVSHTTGFWECPDLFPLPVDGNEANPLWVMWGASGTYMIGRFDGEKFTPLSGKHRFAGGTLYATQTYNNTPDGRRIAIAWGRQGHPGENFNGQMLIPTELSLRTTKDGVRLVSKPVAEFEAIAKPVGSWKNLTQDQANEILAKQADTTQPLRIRAKMRLSHATDAFLELNGRRVIDYDLNQTRLNGYHYSPQDPTSMELTADVYIDRTSTEAFFDSGLFSDSQERDMKRGSSTPRFGGNRITIEELDIYTLPSIWEK